MRIGLSPLRLRSLTVAALPAALFVATAAHAQQPNLTGPQVQSPQIHRSYQPRYEGVEQMVGDMSLLATSLRSLQSGLQQPSGFEGVFRVPPDPNNPGSQARLMRIDGAIAATFPQSEYMSIYLRERRMFVERITKIGDVPLVPSGTVFHIGLPTIPASQPEPREKPPLAVVPVSAAQRVVQESLIERHVANDASSTASIRERKATAGRAPDAAMVALDHAESQDRETRVRGLLLRAAEAERIRH